MASLARAFAVLIASVLVSACSQPAASSRSTPAPLGPATAAAADAGTTTAAAAVDRGAIQALDRMAAYLRTLNAFQIASDTTRDEVLDDGQRIQFGGHVEILVQRPDRLRAEVTSDRQQ